MFSKTRCFMLSIVYLGLTGVCLGQTSSWYPFQSQAPTDPGVIGMNDWWDKPAGRHGRVRREGDQLVYNGKPIKLWGLNNSFSACAPDRPIAERRAKFYVKYGVNSVRLHKFADGTGWSGILSKDSAVTYDPEGLDRMDYYVAQLKDQGIFVKLSPTFGPPSIGRAEADRVPFIEEFGEFGGDGRIRVPHSTIFFSPEIQDVHIQQMMNLLQHTNPYTGKRYADDPVVWDLEIVNEQSILFFTSSQGLEASPTLREQVGERFSSWLEDRYDNQAGLVKAWGEAALNSFELAQNESLENQNVLPIGNPWHWDPDNLDAPAQAFRRQRMLDTLEFLTSLQLEFYQRYVAAVREVGYEGEISASNWQAGRAFSHFANLWTDAQVGTIDRHNYYAGGRGKKVNNDSMLATAGSGMLSTGMQQVADLPFMLSEWIHVWPSQWGAEGPAIIGAYGMGLQGWDVSYMFQNRDEGGFSRRLGRSDWDVTTPQILGLFPAVARQVLRGDVETAETSAKLFVHAPSLFQGEGLDFDDRTAQGYDEKAFETGKVARRALGVARVEVEFTERPTSTPQFDMSPYERDDLLVSSTGQLRWHEAPAGQSQGGWIVVDSAPTQALVGFAPDHSVQTQDAQIESHSPFAAVYLSALGADETIENADRVLVTALGRAKNQGQQFSEDHTRLLQEGESPVLLEPIRATIQLRRDQKPVVRLLDHDGRLTDRTVNIQGNTLEIDTGRDRTPYYMLDYRR